jgi:DNA-binding NarL/FixJ family response regulator
MINVLIADDQQIITRAYRIVLEKEVDIKVVATAVNGTEAAELCGQYPIDVVLMDVMMPNCDGVTGVKLIKEKYPHIKVIMITSFDDDAYIREALKNGADGYLLKSIGDEELKAALRSIIAGFSLLPQKVLNHVKENYERIVDGPTEKKLVDHGLTKREMEVLHCIVDGKSNKEIASYLDLAEGRVKNLISTLLTKLNVQDRTQLAVYALKNNVI